MPWLYPEWEYLLSHSSLGRHSWARYAPDTAGMLEGLTERAVAKTAPLSAFPATEQAVLRYNKTAGGTPLVPVYPVEGVPDADHPFLLLDAPRVKWDRRAAAQAFLDFALGGARRAAYARAGFRDRDRSTQRIARLAPDHRLLQQVSRVTRGRTYVCRKPADLGRVFLAAMVNR